MIERITISGLHSEPKNFSYGTIVRILMKHGAKVGDIYRVERDLAEDGRAKFKKFTLSKSSDKVWSKTKTSSRRESWPSLPL